MMMKVFIDITLLPSDDIGHHFLWEKVYQQVHLALVENQDANGGSSVGISFPEYSAEKHRLGRKLRVFAPDRSTLETLSIQRWLNRLADYAHVSSVREVPETVKHHARFSRLKEKGGNPERFARRAAKRQGITFEKALGERKSIVAQRLKAPFIWTKSHTNGNRFPLIVGHKVIVDDESGRFCSYGLSKSATVPWF